jgi:hypothetical protein
MMRKQLDLPRTIEKHILPLPIRHTISESLLKPLEILFQLFQRV